MTQIGVGSRVRYTGTDVRFRHNAMIGLRGVVLRVDVDNDTATVGWFDGERRPAVRLENLARDVGPGHTNILPTDAAARNDMPMADGLLDYFPNALAAVAKLSKVANEQHNPGEPMHWARNKSTDHRNKIVKHLIDAGGIDSDGQPHSAKVAWRALALLEDELIAAGAVPGRNAIGAPAPLAEQHRRVASAAELAAYAIKPVPHNCIEDEV